MMVVVGFVEEEEFEVDAFVDSLEVELVLQLN